MNGPSVETLSDHARHFLVSNTAHLISGRCFKLLLAGMPFKHQTAQWIQGTSCTIDLACVYNSDASRFVTDDSIHVCTADCRCAVAKDLHQMCCMKNMYFFCSTYLNLHLYNLCILATSDLTVAARAHVRHEFVDMTRYVSVYTSDQTVSALRLSQLNTESCSHQRPCELLEYKQTALLLRRLLAAAMAMYVSSYYI